MKRGRPPIWPGWADRLGISRIQARNLGEFECLRLTHMSPEAREAMLSIIRKAKKGAVGPYKPKFAHLREPDDEQQKSPSGRGA